MTPILFVLGPRTDDVRRVAEGLERLKVGIALPSPPADPSTGPGDSFHELNRRLLRLFALPPDAPRLIEVATLPPALAEWFADEALRLIRAAGNGFVILPSTELAPTLPFWREALRPHACLLVLRRASPSIVASAADRVIVLDPEVGQAREEQLRDAARRLSGSLAREGLPAISPDQLAATFEALPAASTERETASEPDARFRKAHELTALLGSPALARPQGERGDSGFARFDWKAAVDLARESGDVAEAFAQAMALALEEKEAARRALQEDLTRQARRLSRQPRQINRLKQREQDLNALLKLERTWRHELRRDPFFRFFTRLPGRSRWLTDPGVEFANDASDSVLPVVSRRSRNRDAAKLESGLDTLRRAVWKEPWPWPVEDEDRLLAPSPREVDFWLDLRQSLRTRPLFSVLFPVHRVKPDFLRAALQSVFDQVYERWELCVALDQAVGPENRKMIQAFRERFPERIRVVEIDGIPGIAGSTNRAADMAAGDFIAFLDHDDRMTPDALLLNAHYLQGRPETDLIYSDEDCMDEQGALGLVLRKPGFSPELLLSCNYIIHLVCIRKALFDRIGRIREGFEYSQDYDLLLRATEQARHIAHLPRVLYHWRMHEASSTHDPLTRKKHSRELSQRALQDAAERRGWAAEVARDEARDAYRVIFQLDPASRVSVIIADAGDVAALRACLRSVRLHTRFRNFEILVVTSSAVDAPLADFLKQRVDEGEIRWLRDEKAAGAAARRNFAVRHCDTPYIVFLSAGAEAREPGWLDAMIEHAQRPEIGAVGGQLVSPGFTVRQAGIYFAPEGRPGFAFRDMPSDFSGPFGTNLNVRNCLAVSDACMMMRREAFLEMEGFDEAFTNRCHDIDLCLRLSKAGRRMVYTPFARLVLNVPDLEASEDSGRDEAEGNSDLELLCSRWDAAELQDPYFLPDMDAGMTGSGMTLDGAVPCHGSPDSGAKASRKADAAASFKEN